MNVNLRYGRGELSIDLPQELDVTLIRKPKMPIIETATLSINEALSNPISSPSLDELSVGIKTVCILICDITRPVPNGLILKPLISKLLNQGIRAD